MRSSLLSCILLAGALAGSAQTMPDHFYFEEGKVRVLILTGRNNHEWRLTTPYLRHVLEIAGRFDVRVSEEPSSLSAEALRPYDVLLVNYCGPRWSAETEQAVAGFVRGGKGMVAVHAASYSFGDQKVFGEHMVSTNATQAPWPEWAQMVGGAWSGTAPISGHAPRHVYQVEWQQRDHPIAAGLPPAFTVSDELYHSLRVAPGVQVLASAMDDAAIGGTGKREPLLWTNVYGSGRVFHTALGHDVDAMQAPGFLVSLVRGTEWAASGRVTLPARIDTNPKNADALRVLLVTGGHDHESSFYAVFEGHRDLRVNVDPHPVAFRNDLRKSYDVLVLYDTIQADQLPESHRQNLRDFVESGKGVVVLHHAIADFQQWEWWWKEVVGGRYILNGEPGYPASKYLHDVDLVVTPKTGHPIVKGLPPMRLFDETYHYVWHREDVQVLLTVSHPTSDADIAWVSPYSRSRVVYIQPGHGRETHESPWYRQLVHNAIAWAGGRPPL